MFKPRWMMSARQRELKDARYADLLEFRRELAAMGSIERSRHARELAESSVWLRRRLRLDGGAMLACLVATALILGEATVLHSLLLLVAAVLLPFSAIRMLEHYALSRDAYFGMLRQIREACQPPEPSRFDD